MSEESIAVFTGARAPVLESLGAGTQFATWLTRLGYSPISVSQSVMFVMGLLRWMGVRGTPLSALDEQLVNVALAERRRPKSKSCRRAFLHFLEHLRGRGVVAPLQLRDDDSPSMRLEREYARYLSEERGLVDVTVVNYCGLVRGLLVGWFVRGAAQLADLSPRDVADFLLERVRSMSPRRAQLLGCALRSFLHFLFLKARTTVDLSRVVPSVRQYRKAAVPRYVAPKEVEQIIAACDLKTSIGRRDRAVLLLLARLGLRASEVVKLDLDDVRWRAGELMVRGKGGVHDLLPLPSDVGEALARYLRRDRPVCSSRRLFLRMRAPRRGFESAAAVTTIVERAVDRSGLQPPHRGAHLLRHSLATGMIQRGATMAEIGQLLRHRSPSTTELYAKVDFERLRSVALPWLGGAR